MRVESEDVGAMSMMMKMQAEVKSACKHKCAFKSHGGGFTRVEAGCYGIPEALWAGLCFRRKIQICSPTISLCSGRQRGKRRREGCRSFDIATSNVEGNDADAALSFRARPINTSHNFSLLDSTVVLGGVTGWGRSTLLIPLIRKSKVVV